LQGEHLPRALNGRYLEKILLECMVGRLSSKG
jgi:hypothetical protein